MESGGLSMKAIEYITATWFVTDVLANILIIVVAVYAIRWLREYFKDE